MSQSKLQHLITVRYNCNDEQEEIIKDRMDEVIEDLRVILEARLGDGVGLGLVEYELEEIEG